MDDILRFRKSLARQVEVLSNVELYDFQTNIDITVNLNNYKDLFHFREEVNDFILEKIFSKYEKVNFETANIQVLESIRLAK